MIGWILLGVFAALTVYSSNWWSIGLAIMVLWQASQWQRYKSRPWRRIHFPAMVLWSGAAGLETGKAEKERREYDPVNALHIFVKSINPGLSLEAVPSFLSKAIAQYADPKFENVIREKLALKSASVAQADADKVIQIVVDKFKSPDLELKVKMVIAEVVKTDAGEAEYIEYLRGILTNKAA